MILTSKNVQLLCYYVLLYKLDTYYVFYFLTWELRIGNNKLKVDSTKHFCFIIWIT